MSILQGKTILVTGASSGIGKATAEALAREGAKLIITARRETLLKEVAAGLPTPTHALVLDARDREAIAPALASLPKEFSTIDGLVNNAGLALGLHGTAEAEWSDWETMIETNIVGLIAMTRQVLPGMKARGGGHVVNISSIAGNYHYPGSNVYGASKAFVTYFSLAMRADLQGTNVRVTNIEPGMTETEFSQVRFHGDTARAATVYQGVTPLSAEDIAETVRWAMTQPAHVNINRIEVMPTCQAPGGPMVHRAAKN